MTLPLAIVIPTLNEEKHIGILLDSLASQNSQPDEIIIVDAYSKDKTIEEINSRKGNLPKLKIFQIEKSTVAKQRNFGASKTTTPHILFLDADTSFPNTSTLKEYFDEILEKKPDIAMATNLPLGGNFKDKLFFFGMDIFFKVIKFIWPSLIGANVYLKREAFEKNSGFDEKIKIAEDFEFVQRVVKNNGKFEILKNAKILTSPRRLKKEGYFRFVIKLIKSFIYIQTYGYQNNPIKYELGHHSE